MKNKKGNEMAGGHLNGSSKNDKAQGKAQIMPRDGNHVLHKGYYCQLFQYY